MARRGSSDTWLIISSHTPEIMKGNWKPLKETVKKKVPQNAVQASIWLWRKVKSRIRRSNSQRDVKPVEYKIFAWGKRQNDWYPLTRSPTEFMRGKRSVASHGGRGGRYAVRDIKDVGSVRWGKPSKPGEGPRSHPSDVPGWRDHWLREAVFWSKETAQSSGTIRIYVDEKLGGSKVRNILRALEFGGSSTLNKKWVIGYTASTIRSGYKTTGTRSLKNRSGRTLRSHKRKFREPHVSLTRRWKKIEDKSVSIAPRPFMGPVQEAFFRDFFPEYYQKNFLK